jgi:hypothetical protein
MAWEDKDLLIRGNSVLEIALNLEVGQIV